MSDSSDESVSEAGSEFEVERIIAETDVESEIFYLVKWKGYESEQCTWEPARNFLNPETLRDWVKLKARGDVLDDDQVAQVQASMDAFQARNDEEEQPQPKRRKLSTVSADDTIVVGQSPTRRLESLKSPRSPGAGRHQEIAKPVTVKKTLPAPRPQPPNTFHGVGGMKAREASSSHKVSTTKAHWKSPVLGEFLRRTARQQNIVVKHQRQELIPTSANTTLKPAAEWADSAREPAHVLPAGPMLNADSSLFIPEESTTEHVTRPSNTDQKPQPTSITSSANAATPPTIKQPQLPPLKTPNLRTQPIAQPLTAAALIEPRNTNKAPTPKELMERREVDSRTMMPVPRRQSTSITGNNRPYPHQDRDRQRFRDGIVETQFYFGECNIGVVDLHFGKTHWLKLKFRDQGRKPELHFRYELCAQRQEYMNITRGWPTRHLAIVPVIPQPASKLSLIDVAEYLQKNDLAFTWQHPDFHEDFVFTLYSRHAPSWKISPGTLNVPVETDLQLLVRNTTARGQFVQEVFGGDSNYQKWPWEERRRQQKQYILESGMQSLRGPTVPPPSSRMDIDPVKRTPTTDDPRIDATGIDRRVAARNRTSTMTRDLLMTTSENIPPKTAVADTATSKKVEQMQSDVEQPSQPPPEYEFTTDEAALLRSVRAHNSKDNRAIMIVAALGDERAAEAKAIKTWASKHVHPRCVFVINSPDDWKSFHEFFILQDKNRRAIVFLDARRPVFARLPRLGSLLMRPNTAFFQLCFKPPLGHQLQYQIDQVLREGTVLMLSEHSMVAFPSECAGIMEWFNENKKNSGAWRLVVRPMITDWLIGQAQNCPSESKKHFATMLHLAYTLSDQKIPDLTTTDSASDTLPVRLGRMSTTDTNNQKEDAGLLLMPCLKLYETKSLAEQLQTEAVAAERSKSMVEYFCGWAAMNVRHHRRFLAIDVQASSCKDVFGTTPAAHVVFRHPVRFFEESCKVKTRGHE